MSDLNLNDLDFDALSDAVKEHDKAQQADLDDLLPTDNIPEGGAQ